MTNEDADVLTFEEVEKAADAELVHVLVELMLLQMNENAASHYLLDLLEAAGALGDELRKGSISYSLHERAGEASEIDSITKDDCLRHFETQCVRRESYSVEIIVDCLSNLSARIAAKDRESYQRRRLAI